MPVALITGASRGIGAATARRMAAAGIDLRLVARSAQALESLASELRQLCRRVDTCPLDLCDSAAIAPAISDLCCRGSAPDVVVNNAGAAWTGPLAAMPLERWQWLLQLNCLSRQERPAWHPRLHPHARFGQHPLWDSETVGGGFDRHAMLAPEQIADSLLFMARQPPSQTVEDLTLMPAAGAF